MFRREQREVGQFLGVGREIVELWGIGWAGDVFPDAAADHHHGGDGAFTAVFGDDGVGAAGDVLEVREKRVPVHGETGDERCADEIYEGREDVEG